MSNKSPLRKHRPTLIAMPMGSLDDPSSRSTGDKWRGGGGHRRGQVGEGQLEEITAGRVAREIVAVVRRSVG